MAIIRRMIGRELTPEQHEAAQLRIQKAAERPYTYDPNSPLLTEKQLEEFRPVHFKNMEERAEAMMKDGNWHPIEGLSWEERARQMDETGIKTSDSKK